MKTMDERGVLASEAWRCQPSELTVLPPLPMTRPAAEAGTRMWVSNFTSSLGPKKFSSFSLP